MARPLKYPEKILVRLSAGTIERLKAVVDERQTGPLVRELIERELKRRERGKPNIRAPFTDL